MILCSTGALLTRNNGRNWRILGDVSKELECDGYEFMIYESWYGELNSVVSYIKDLGLIVPVIHADKRIGVAISGGAAGEIGNALADFAVNCDAAKSLGAGKVVLHLWGGAYSDYNFCRTLEVYPLLAAIAREKGLELLIENIVCAYLDPIGRWKQLRNMYPDVRFIYDTKMAEFHRQAEELYSEENAWLWKEGHIRHFHVNDYDGGYMEWEKLRTLPIGKGHVNFQKFFDFTGKIGYSGAYTVEATSVRPDGSIDVPTLNACFRYIREHTGRQ